MSESIFLDSVFAVIEEQEQTPKIMQVHSVTVMEDDDKEPSLHLVCSDGKWSLRVHRGLVRNIAKVQGLRLLWGSDLHNVNYQPAPTPLLLVDKPKSYDLGAGFRWLQDVEAAGWLDSRLRLGVVTPAGDVYVAAGRPPKVSSVGDWQREAILDMCLPPSIDELTVAGMVLFTNAHHVVRYVEPLVQPTKLARAGMSTLRAKVRFTIYPKES